MNESGAGSQMPSGSWSGARDSQVKLGETFGETFCFTETYKNTFLVTVFYYPDRFTANVLLFMQKVIT